MRASTKHILVIIITTLTIGGYYSISTTSDELKSIELIVNYPIIMKNKDSGWFINVHDSITIHFYRKLVMYRLPLVHDFETDKPIPGSETWFIYREKDSLGIWVDSLLPKKKGMPLPVDSFLRNRCFYGADFDIHHFGPSWLLHTIVKDKQLTIEKYFLNKVHAETEPDSLYLCFANDLQDINYSLSRKLDSSRKMKLVTARLLYKEQFSDSANILLPKRELFFKIRKEEPKNQEQVIAFMKEFE